ncbi:oligosaccharide flippase family protein [Arenibacter sp. M-2]|uniref:lipopolysaccharide biosynthesis protein n=1 Tax=Arenibacter sp. M-2 TaxID=3053612 RepID=UPI00256FF99C|nr:oligosaccharide flippase family protein [Arenibacter sp. M-2]MDL5514660.1 oligosaccharide flippase family protein [Arenibacter sp. M-2]
MTKVSDNKQTFWLAFGKIIALFATFFVPLFLTRFLNKEEYGFYNQFNTVIFFLSSFFSFGISSNIFYFYPTNLKKNQKSLLYHTVFFLLIFGLLSALFIYLPYFSEFFLANDELQNYKTVIYLLTIILVLTTIIHPLYVVKKDLVFSVWFPTFQVAIKAIFIVGFFFIIPSINSVINAIIVSSSIVLLIIIGYIGKSIKKGPDGQIYHKEQAIIQFRYNLPIGAAIAIKTFSQKFDKLVGITYLSASSYASYSIAFFGIPGIQQIYDSISQVTVINMVKCFSNGEIRQAHNLYKSMVIKTLSFSIPIILIVTLNAKEIIIFLFTNKYSDATILFQLYLISFIFVMLGAGLILRASGNTKFIIRAFLYASIISIPSTYFLIKNYGSVGAMCGALISIILPKFYQIKKEIEFTESTLYTFLPWKQIGTIFLISLVSIAPFTYLKNNIIDRNIIYVVITSSIYLLIVTIIEINFDLFIIKKAKLLKIKNDFLNTIR